MKYAIIEGGLVVNMALSDSAIGSNWIQTDSAKIGDSYADGVFTSAPLVRFVPSVVSMRQARKALIMGGVTIASVDSAIAATVDDQERALAQTDWEYAATVSKHSALVDSMAAALGLDAAAVDDLFISAAALAE